MAKINIGSSHDSSRTKLQAELQVESALELNVGDGFDDSMREIHITEYQGAIIRAEVEKLKSELSSLQSGLREGSQVKELATRASELSQSAEAILNKRKWYSVSIQGLLEAAKAVGEAASPLASSAVKIVELLSKLK